MSRSLLALALATISLGACSSDTPGVAFGQAGFIRNPAVDEASGMQAGSANPDALFIHNDDGAARLYVIDDRGNDLGQVEIAGAVNVDWEDITAVPGDGETLLVIADTGDNFARRGHVSLYFVPEPQAGPAGRYEGSVRTTHRIDLRYPDGPRDCESLAWDAHGHRLLLLSKRDTPPRIYAIALEQALAATQAELEYLGEAHRFRPPSAADLRRFGPRDGPWVSQPTGLDIDADGRRAVVISYRSLYLFRREEGQDWTTALAGKPLEFEAPPSLKEEAVSFQHGGRFVIVTTEGRPAPVYRFNLADLDP